MSKFKKGDKIICNNAINNNLTEGRLYTALEYSPEYPMFIRMINDLGEKNGYRDSCFDLAKSEKPAFKVGDRVTCIDDYVRQGWLTKGNSYIVSKITIDPIRLKLEGTEGVHNPLRFKLYEGEKEMRRAFKVGDVVECASRKSHAAYGRKYVVEKVLTWNDGSMGHITVKGVSQDCKPEDFYLVTPVEDTSTFGVVSELDELIETANNGLTALRELSNNLIYKEKVELYDKGYNSSYFLSNCKSINLKYDKAVRKVEEKKVTKTTVHLQSGVNTTVQANITDMRVGCKEFKTAEIRKALPLLLNGSWGSARITQLNGGSTRQLTATRTGLKYHSENITWKDAELINIILEDAFGKYND